MPGEVTALYTEAGEKLTDYYTYLTTIQATLASDLKVHANVINGLASMVFQLDTLITSINALTEQLQEGGII